MKHVILVLATVFLLTGCNQGDNKSVKMINDTYHKIPTGYTTSKADTRKTREEREDDYKKELELAKLKSEENLKIAKIDAEAKEEAKRIESEALKTKIFAEKEVHLQAQKTQKEIAASKEQHLAQTREKDLRFNMILTAVAASIVLIFLLVWYLVHRKNKAAELKMHEEKLRHEAVMEAGRQHHEKIGRFLEIIADENTDTRVKHKLIAVLGEQVTNQNLIAYEQDEPEENENIEIDEAEDINEEDDEKADETSK